MDRWWPCLGLALAFAVTPPLWAQQPAPPTPQQLAAQEKKAYQYLRIEYERCRNDVSDIWVKGDAMEQRAKDLEEEVRKLTDELTELRGKASEKPAN